MYVYRVALFGHRYLSSVRELANKLYDAAEKLIRANEFVEFYIGRNGEFDELAASVIKRVQSKHGKEKCALILVLPYAVKDIKYFEKYYDEIMLPVDPQTHFKAAIAKRNEWMADNCELVISCVQKESGGAYRAIKHAEKRGVPVLNLGDEMHDIT